MKQLDTFSLLWLDRNMKKSFQLPQETAKDLDLPFVCNQLTSNENDRKSILAILSELPKDRETIQYRSDIFSDLMESKKFRIQLKEILKELQVIGDFKNVKMISMDSSSIWELINRLKELYSYIDCIKRFQECFAPQEFKSDGLNQFKNMIHQIYTDSGFEYLQQDIARLSGNISEIRSLTLGVNLDKDLNPKEVQLLSLNKTEYQENENGILKAFITCFAGSMANSLLKSDKAVDPLMNALTRRVEEMLSTVVSDMKNSLNKYIDVSGYAITRLVPELKFYIYFADAYERIRDKLPLCKATCMSADQIVHIKMSAQDFYNIKLALYDLKKEGASEIVTNDIVFDKAHMQYILTGPNRGGKTIFTQAIGQLYLLAQSGLYVPAGQMTFTPVDQIYTHFPADENKTVELGRLGEEAERIHTIMEHTTSATLILLNESLSTTSFSEGLFIARDIVKAVNYIGASMIYNTHMHELAKEVDVLEVGQPSVVSLVMGIEGEKRSYKAVISPPVGSSFAKDIARKYGILFEQLKGMVDQNQPGAEQA